MRLVYSGTPSKEPFDRAGSNLKISRQRGLGDGLEVMEKWPNIAGRLKDREEVLRSDCIRIFLYSDVRDRQSSSKGSKNDYDLAGSHTHTDTDTHAPRQCAKDFHQSCSTN